MWNRDGGPRILQMFQIQQNSDLPPESCENKSPVTHSNHRKREKWALSTQPTRSLSHQHVRQSGKVCGALLTLCCMFSYVFRVFVCMGVCCMYKVYWRCPFLVRTIRESWVWGCANGSTERPLIILVCVCELCRMSVFSIFYSPLASCSLYRLPLSVCPLGQCLWTSAMKRPLSGSSGVCWKIPTWTQQTLQLHENPASG